MSIRKAFEMVLDSTAEATKLNAARVAGKVAKEVIFSNPDTLQGVLTAGAVLNIAALADPDSAHGKALHYLGLGLALDASDEVLRHCDEAGVFQFKGTAEASNTADIQASVSAAFNSEPFQKMIREAEGTPTVVEAEPTKTTKVRFSTQAKPAGVPANAIDNPTKPTEEQAVVVKAGPEVTTPVLIPAVKEPATELVCSYAGCGLKLRKQSDRKKLNLPKDAASVAVITEEETKLDGTYMCKQHRTMIITTIQRRVAEARANSKREAALTVAEQDLTNLEAEVREDEKALTASEKTAAKVAGDPTLAAATTAILTEKRNSIQKKRVLARNLNNKVSQLKKELGRA